MDTTIEKIRLANFRNHISRTIITDGLPVVFTGPNGIGKTNILEAISLFSPGRGLRDAKLEEMSGSGNEWAVSLTLRSDNMHIHLASGFVEGNKRIYRIDDKTQKTAHAFTEYLDIIWLTPQMDQILQSGASTRRKFFDRIVGGFIHHHYPYLQNYENLAKQRLKLLRGGSYDPIWLGGIEGEMAKLSVDLAINRIEIMRILQNHILEAKSDFPKALLKFTSEIELAASEEGADNLNEKIKNHLRNNRELDRIIGRNSTGAHKCDIAIYFLEKQLPLALASTGEQKALLISIILAQVESLIAAKSRNPIIVFDEIPSHLDENRRQLLYDYLLNLKLQFFLTGISEELFYFPSHTVKLINLLN